MPRTTNKPTDNGVIPNVVIDGSRPGHPAPLVLDDGAHRIERYEMMGPAGFVYEITHNIDTGETWHKPTDRTEIPDPGL